MVALVNVKPVPEPGGESVASDAVPQQDCDASSLAAFKTLKQTILGIFLLVMLFFLMMMVV